MVSKVASSIARYPGQGQKSVSVENNFIGGLKTEFTGLNFPENACTATSNCVFSIIGDVERRGGIDFEANAVKQPISTASVAMNTYRWRNAGGDGATEILVQQVGTTLYFFQSSAATTALPLSSQRLTSTVGLSTFLVSGNTTAQAQVLECQFFDGNGFLLVTHPLCDPFYCMINSGVITAKIITIQVRDFLGFPDGLGIQGSPQSISKRPTSLSQEHLYNLLNQGWTNAAGWSYSQSSFTGSSYTLNPDTGTPGNYASATVNLGAYTISGGVPPKALVAAGAGTGFNYLLTVTATVPLGGSLEVVGTAEIGGSGIVTSILSNSVHITITSGATGYFAPSSVGDAANFTATMLITSTGSQNTIGIWHNALGNYPSNADVWFAYLNAAGNFAPGTAIVVEPSTPAPQGHFVLNAFNQLPSTLSGVTGLTNITTTARPTTGCWFQGRAFFSGVNASQGAQGDQGYYTWTENIYFSQVVQDQSMFGLCYQENDPTNRFLFDVLPTDGGVITIPGTGAIYRLFPITNGLLVFAQNGVWFITGSQGLGFTATDFSVNKISNVQSISTTSFVNVLGMPVFWNLEGIYSVSPAKENTPYSFGGMKVEPLTVGTILSFYNNIPLDSKKYARGDYDPISYILQWTYRSTQESGISNRYSFDSALCLNIHNKAFYPYTFAASNTCSINGIFYITYPNSSAGPTAQFKYLTTVGSNLTYSEENNFTKYVDWFTNDGVGVNYTSSFTTGYKLHGQGYRRWKPIYLYMYLRNTTASSYTIQAVWDFATTSIGRESLIQTVNTFTPKFGMLFRRHKLRGHGHAMQFTISSVSGQPFDIMGWSIPEASNIGA